MRQLLVEGAKTFKIDIPDDAKVTFGPWSPSKMSKENGSHMGGDRNELFRGTLRIYEADGKTMIGMFSPVVTFRDLSKINYSEQVAKEEGATIWKSDTEGYQREDKVKRTTEWKTEPKLIASGKSTGKKVKK